jgi:general secretion pathway protein C
MRRFARFTPGALCLATALASAAWIAQGLSWLSQEPAELLVDDAPAAAQGVLSGERASRARVVAEQVLLRNIFDSRVGPLTWHPPPPTPALTDEGTTHALAGASLARCASDTRLLAAVVRDKRPERSLALVQRAGEADLVPVGGAVGDARLLALRPQLAYLEQTDGTVCFLSVYLSSEERKARAATRSKTARKKVKQLRAKASKKGSRFSKQELDAAIQKQGENRFLIDRGLLERALANPAALSRGARFKSYKQSGRVVGMRVVKLSRSSALRRLGIERGDILRTLNGYELATPDGLLSAVALAREARHVTVAVTRHGKPQVLQFTVQ